MNTLILLTDLIEKAILILLGGLSIWSISIIIDRRRYFKAQFLNDEYNQIKQSLSNEGRFKAQSSGFYAQAALAFQQPSTLQTDRAYSSFIKENREHLEKGLNVLATLGANAPFIGLLGTVLGIIRALAYLGNQAGSSSVMSGVSQALYATAIGLFVAIPAVVAFNTFSNQIKRAVQKTDSLKDLYVAKSGLK
ncbi:MAG: MotA/TolQ/ExbB proton channel family protein [Moraxellaceae bacterium]|nr:MotA/TolQ/ExbB proton channel family protein [Pseudobdellovibrionaceae bacterium]